MNLAFHIFFSVNLCCIAAFTLGFHFIFKQKQKPKLQSGYSLFLGILLVIYFIAIMGVVVFSLLNQKYYPTCLLAFIVLPFVIGIKATYEKLSFYSSLQLAMFFASLLASYVLIRL